MQFLQNHFLFVLDIYRILILIYVNTLNMLRHSIHSSQKIPFCFFSSRISCIQQIETLDSMVFNATSKQYVNDIVAISFIGKKPQYPTKTTDLP